MRRRDLRFHRRPKPEERGRWVSRNRKNKKFWRKIVLRSARSYPSKVKLPLLSDFSHWATKISNYSEFERLLGFFAFLFWMKLSSYYNFKFKVHSLQTLSGNPELQFQIWNCLFFVFSADRGQKETSWGQVHGREEGGERKKMSTGKKQKKLTKTNTKYKNEIKQSI